MTQLELRDQALDRLEATRADLLVAARAMAAAICAIKGRVTSVEVMAQLRLQGYGPELDAADTRWLGAVFWRGGWTRIGYEPTGSHGRPVAIWRRA